MRRSYLSYSDICSLTPLAFSASHSHAHTQTHMHKTTHTPSSVLVYAEDESDQKFVHLGKWNMI